MFDDFLKIFAQITIVFAKFLQNIRNFVFLREMEKGIFVSTLVGDDSVKKNKSVLKDCYRCVISLMIA